MPTFEPFGPRWTPPADYRPVSCPDARAKLAADSLQELRERILSGEVDVFGFCRADLLPDAKGNFTIDMRLYCQQRR